MNIEIIITRREINPDYNSAKAYQKRYNMSEGKQAEEDYKKYIEEDIKNKGYTYTTIEIIEDLIVHKGVK